MKALISAFALLAFVGASTVPYVAHAQTQTQQTTPKKVKKKSTKGKKHASVKKTKKKAAPVQKG